ncbi:TatD family hydrolase [Saccharospirillum sp. MSK14-1]|uniref:TatD family hydrolase n=1 Tax=Saccharospirillum sp. MSK14-1 TaxID=1897632 RepID=UPI000D396A9C|nr:TatD family hydrolase [Saccharospirillum sp. MSK14-1]
MTWIDAHCHPDALSDPDGAFSEAQAAGIGQWILPGTEPQQWRAAGQRFSSDSRIRLAFGHHPWFLPNSEPDLSALQAMLSDYPPCIALGEIGLDFHQGKTPKAAPELQERWFEAQLAMAAEHRLPVIVHAVKAHDRVLALLKHYPDVRGVVHAFLGPYQQARAYLDKGWYLGCGSLILKSAKTREAFAQMPVDRILLETDAPDMRPMQPQHTNPLLDLLQTADCLAQARSISLAILMAHTSANVRQLFQKF